MRFRVATRLLRSSACPSATNSTRSSRHAPVPAAAIRVLPVACDVVRASEGRSARRAHALALEDLGPIWVKFGQALSTRRDLLPNDIADELAKLQDRVPPFPARKPQAIIEGAYGKPVAEVFRSSTRRRSRRPRSRRCTSRELRSGEEVVVKIAASRHRAEDRERPRGDVRRSRGWRAAIRRTAIGCVRARSCRSSKRPSSTSSTSCARRRTRRSCGATSPARTLLYVPDVYWDYCRARRDGDGTHSRRARERHGTNCATRHRTSRRWLRTAWRSSSRRCSGTTSSTPTCTRATSSCRPTTRNGRVYAAVDFGIVGSLDGRDQHYLAENFLAFFDRDYNRVARLHIDSGWVPRDTRVDELEAGDPHRVRTHLQQAVVRDFLRTGAAAAVRSRAPLRHATCNRS